MNSNQDKHDQKKHDRHFGSFKIFYPYYLTEHSNRTSRKLHFIGTFLVLIILFYIIVSRQWWLIVSLPIAGYGFAWLGHYVFEKNKPATFKHPIYSLIGDFVMFRDILMGKIKF